MTASQCIAFSVLLTYHEETVIFRACLFVSCLSAVGPLLEGYQSRLFEFSNFERKFEECISRSAVKTKFAQHAHKGKLMVTELKEVMGALLERCRTLRSVEV